MMITLCCISYSVPLIAHYPTHPTLPHLSRSIPPISIYRTNSALLHRSKSTSFIPLYFTNPTLSPYPTFPTYPNLPHLSPSTQHIILLFHTYPTQPKPSNSTPPIPLYPTHLALLHLSQSTPCNIQTRTKITNANKNYKHGSSIIIHSAKPHHTNHPTAPHTATLDTALTITNSNYNDSIIIMIKIIAPI